jgi:hypothetical protein
MPFLGRRIPETGSFSQKRTCWGFREQSFAASQVWSTTLGVTLRQFVIDAKRKSIKSDAADVIRGAKRSMDLCGLP